MPICFNWKSLSMLWCISLHAHAYKLMLCIVFMKFGWSITQIHFLEETFSTGCLMDSLIYFLILTLAAAQQVLEKYHARYHALDAVAAPLSLMSTVNSLIRFLQVPQRECRFMQPKTKFSWQMICKAGKFKHFMVTFEYFFVNSVQVWLKTELK